VQSVGVWFRHAVAHSSTVCPPPPSEKSGALCAVTLGSQRTLPMIGDASVKNFSTAVVVIVVLVDVVVGHALQLRGHRAVKYTEYRLQ
jgi:hypothetical protein